MSTLKVNTISASTSGQGVDVDIKNPKTNRNLIINGAMVVAQRGTSNTLTNGYGTVDRFQVIRSGVDENTTQSQVDVASGTTPYTLGFRKAFRVTNGNQTAVGTSDYVSMRYQFEAQDIANSGWNYLSSSSYVTLSFWCKSSVSQNFYGYFETQDGTQYAYPFETGTLTADTWTKITKTIPGNSNLTFDNDANNGLRIYITQFWGTDKTGTITLDQWAAYNTNLRMPDFASTWYSTNDATFEITGVQFEVGSVPTDFEHKSRGQELALCQRYYFSIKGDDDEHVAFGYAAGGGFCVFMLPYPVPMRSQPTYTGSATAARFYNNAQSANFNLSSLSFGNADTNSVEPKHGVVFTTTTSGMSTGAGGSLALNADNGILEFSAEL